MSGKVKSLHGVYRALGRDAFLAAARLYSENVQDTVEATLSEMESRWYNDCGLDTDVLDKAVMESSAQFYAAHRQPEPQQTLFDMDDDEDFSYEPEDYEDEELTEDAPEMDENDPFYFSEGMHL